jgi:hypothetical protein
MANRADRFQNDRVAGGRPAGAFVLGRTAPSGEQGEREECESGRTHAEIVSDPAAVVYVAA